MNLSIFVKLDSSCITRAKNLSDYLYKVYVYGGARAGHAAYMKSFLLTPCP